ncbi:LCP family protein [Candidatus Margulisiibacteriota bacterium]
MPDQKNTYKVIAITLIISLVVGLFGFFLAMGVLKLSLVKMLLKIMPQHQLISQMNILIIGVDETGDSQRADTIIVANLNPHTRHIGLISIPRDTRVYIPGFGMDKINHSYTYGGVALVQQAAASFLKIPIPYFVAINMSGMDKVIDEIGGVEIDVEKRMYYIDRAGDLYIDLYPGKQKLSGRKAMGYVRFRHDPSGDIGRAKRQQKFLKAMGQSILKAGLLTKAPFVMKRLGENMKTNLSSREIVTFALKMKEGYQEGKLDMGTIPGQAKIVDGLSYWIPNAVKTEAMVNSIINDFEYVSPKELAGKKSRQVDEARIPPQNLKVEVLNGTGITGFALKGAGYIRRQGYVVPWIGDAKNKDYSETVLVNWRGAKKIVEAEYLAKKIGVATQRIVNYDYPEKDIDFTVVLGKNWR